MIFTITKDLDGFEHHRADGTLRKYIGKITITQEYDLIKEPFARPMSDFMVQEFGAFMDKHVVSEVLEHPLAPGVRVFKCSCNGWKASASAKPMTTGLTLQLQFAAHVKRQYEEI